MLGEDGLVAVVLVLYFCNASYIYYIFKLLNAWLYKSLFSKLWFFLCYNCYYDSFSLFLYSLFKVEYELFSPPLIGGAIHWRPRNLSDVSTNSLTRLAVWRWFFYLLRPAFLTGILKLLFGSPSSILLIRKFVRLIWLLLVSF